VHLAEAEKEEVKELRQILARKRPARRRSLGQSIWSATYHLALYSVKTVRFLVDAVLAFLVFVFLVIWGLKLPHPPKWDVWWGVELIRQIGEPLLAQIDAVLEWPEAVPFYPFILVFVLSIGRVIVDSRLARILRQLRKHEPRSKHEYTQASAINWRLEQDAQKHN
jgi:hypothetical protein